MEKYKINNLNQYPISERNGSYGGNAGSKDGLLIDNEFWMIKYPKSTKGMRPPVLSYMTSPLSEYIGSNIYELLGYDVHETYLGFRNGKIVVACKDFQEKLGDLRELRTLKNVYNEKLEEQLDDSLHSTGTDRIINLDEILIHLKYNPMLSSVSGLMDRFWDCIIIDGFINNNDRNNGNWGLLFKDGALQIAPIFDNGAAFSNKLPDEKLSNIISNEHSMLKSSLDIKTVFGRGDHQFTFSELIEEGMKYPEFISALKRNVPLICNRFQVIAEFINVIPEEFNGLTVCTPVRKDFYLQGMRLRLERILVPALEKIVSKDASLEDITQLCDCQKTICNFNKTSQEPTNRSYDNIIK